VKEKKGSLVLSMLPLPQQEKEKGHFLPPPLSLLLLLLGIAAVGPQKGGREGGREGGRRG